MSVGVTSGDTTLWLDGDPAWVTPLASITKLLAAFAGLVAIEEGTLELDAPAGPEGSTVRHLLSHCAGYGFNDPQVTARPAERRIYSNVGIEVFADHLAQRADMLFPAYVQLAVLDPLSMAATQFAGSPAHGASSSVADLLCFARELLRPTLIAPQTLAAATTVQFPELVGVLPGFGRQAPNPWGLGFEIRGAKDPHWTAPANSPSTFGHFGGAGTFLWIDPVRDLACCVLTNRDFGPWAADAWPVFSAAILDRFS